MNGNPKKQGEEKPKAQVEFQKEGPKLSAVLKKPHPRGNRIKKTVSGPETGWKKVEKSFTERRGVENVNAFLEKTIETAKRVGNQEVLDRATALKENLVYVGEPELQEALEGIARRVVEKAEAGESVLLYIPGLRSERYITTRVAEEVSKLTKDKKETRGRISVTENRKELAENTERIKQAGGKVSIIITDDFAISGSRVRSFAGDVYKELVKKGFSPDEAVSLIEVNLVAAKVDKEYKIREKPLNVRAYYGAKTYKDSKGAFYVSGGVSITGTHSSTDYGFEDPVEEFKKFLAEERESFDLSLPTNIVRPYELQPKPSNKYLDSALQERWESTSQSFQYQAPPPPPPPPPRPPTERPERRAPGPSISIPTRVPEKIGPIKIRAPKAIKAITKTRAAAKKGIASGVKKAGASLLKLGGKLVAKLGLAEVASDAAAALTAATGPFAVVLAPLAKALTYVATWFAEKVIGKIVDFVRRHKEDVALALLLGGGLLGSPILLGTGLLATGIFGPSLVIGRAAALVSTFFGFFGGLLIASIAVPLVVSTVVTILVVALIIFIINSGAYVVPQGPDLPTTIFDNPYIRVEKVATPEEVSNPPPNRTIEYTITITPLQGTLSNISFDNSCDVFGDSSDQPCPSATIPDPPALISPVEPFTFSYQISIGSNINDSIVTDTFTVTADAPTAPGQSSSSSASVIVGNPPLDCLLPSDNARTWPASSRNNLISAILRLTSQHPAFMAKVCAGGSIPLCYDPASVAYWGWHVHRSDCDILFGSGGFTTVNNATFILAHEISHHMSSINGTWYQAYLDSGAPSEGRICSYRATYYESEGFAEGNALYVQLPSYWGSYCSGTYQSLYPLHYNFARDVIF